MRKALVFWFVFQAIILAVAKVDMAYDSEQGRRPDWLRQEIPSMAIPSVSRCNSSNCVHSRKIR